MRQRLTDTVTACVGKQGSEAQCDQGATGKGSECQHKGLHRLNSLAQVPLHRPLTWHFYLSLAFLSLKKGPPAPAWHMQRAEYDLTCHPCSRASLSELC